MPRRRGEKVPAYVAFSGLNYGFQVHKSFHNQYKGELGQTTYSGAAGVFFGANSPKPNRASKEVENGSRISSWCSSSKINTLQQNEWIISASKSGIRGIKSSGASRTVYVPMPGAYNYTWNLTATETEHMGVLGITQATGSTENMVWGSTPKPPRASRRINRSTVSTFIQPKPSIIEAAVAAGWTVTGVNYDLLPND